jgi:hypothetical protein
MIGGTQRHNGTAVFHDTAEILSWDNCEEIYPSTQDTTSQTCVSRERSKRIFFISLHLSLFLLAPEISCQSAISHCRLGKPSSSFHIFSHGGKSSPIYNGRWSYPPLRGPPKNLKPPPLMGSLWLPRAHQQDLEPLRHLKYKQTNKQKTHHWLILDTTKLRMDVTLEQNMLCCGAMTGEI